MMDRMSSRRPPAPPLRQGAPDELKLKFVNEGSGQMVADFMRLEQ